VFWGELGANAGSTQGTHPDILEPNHLSMVLESDASFPRKVLEGALELIVGAIGIFARGIPVVDVHAEALASVDMTGNDWALATKDQFIPLPEGPGEVLGRSRSVIKGTVQLARRQFAVSFLLEPLVVH